MKLWLQTNNIMIWILLCSAIVIVALQQWIEFGEKGKRHAQLPTCRSKKYHKRQRL